MLTFLIFFEFDQQPFKKRSHVTGAITAIVEVFRSHLPLSARTNDGRHLVATAGTEVFRSPSSVLLYFAGCQLSTDLQTVKRLHTRYALSNN